MRRGVPAVALVLLWLAPSAAAAPPAISASATAGRTPFAVTLTGPPDAVWDLGDGTTAAGPVVEHVYAEPGRYTATATAGAESARVELTAYRLAFGAPARAAYGDRKRFTGSIWPPVARTPVAILDPGGKVVARGRTAANGGFRIAARIHGAGPFRARVAGLESDPDAVRLRPRVEARLVGSGVVGEPLRLVARLRPAAAGNLSVVVVRDGKRTLARRYGSSVRIGLASRRPASYRITVGVVAADGFEAPKGRVVTGAVLRPSLRLGSRGPGVRALERRLRELRYALPRVDVRYGLETVQAVMAFQAVEGLPRTGRVDVRTWRALAKASVPRARHRGTHIEVSKGRQYLLVVKGGKVASVVHVSTGATGNTPLGRWRIYRKVTGWDWVLWYPMYFLRGFAIHGYPSVPSHPASHGCVRVPMWIAPTLFSQHGYGQTVYIYW